MRSPLLATILIVWLLPAGSAHALSAKDDRAKLFSPAVIQEEATAIDELREQYQKDLRIQTYPTVPRTRDLFGSVKKMDEGARERYFTHWAMMDARKSYVDGLFILICQDPLEVRVVVQFRNSKPISWEEGEKLQNDMEALLKEKKNDDALRLAVEFFQTRLHAVYGDRFVNPKFDWMGLGSVLLGVVGAWLALYFMHGFSEGTFRAGSAGINPLGLGVGGNVLAGLRAVREGLARQAAPEPPLPLPSHQAPTESDAGGPPPDAN
jgi:hypothetical protein